MKTFITIFFSAIALCVWGADAEMDWNALTEQIRAQRSELARQGVYAFVTNRVTTPCVAPHIHSQCWVDWLPKTNVGRIAFEKEKRELGFEIVRELAKVAECTAGMENIGSLNANADKVLTVGEWLKTEKGYGNHILKLWCEGIALTMIGRISVVAQSDTNCIQKLLSRVDSVHRNLDRRLSILNEEAPHHYNLPKYLSYEDAARDLSREWRAHQLDTWKYYGRKNGRRSFTFENTQNDPHEYAFYVPDPVDGVQNRIYGWWSAKNHDIVCVYGLEGDLAEKIYMILKFRLYVGVIPVPSAKELRDPVASADYRERLRDLWEPYRNAHGEFTACNAIQDIFRGTFLDPVTKIMKTMNNNILP